MSLSNARQPSQILIHYREMMVVWREKMFGRRFQVSEKQLWNTSKLPNFYCVFQSLKRHHLTVTESFMLEICYFRYSHLPLTFPRISLMTRYENTTLGLHACGNREWFLDKQTCCYYATSSLSPSEPNKLWDGSRRKADRDWCSYWVCRSFSNYIKLIRHLSYEVKCSLILLSNQSLMAMNVW